jgi:hypothetical protein
MPESIKSLRRPSDTRYVDPVTVPEAPRKRIVTGIVLLQNLFRLY